MKRTGTVFSRVERSHWKLKNFGIIPKSICEQNTFEVKHKHDKSSSPARRHTLNGQNCLASIDSYYWHGIKCDACHNHKHQIKVFTAVLLRHQLKSFSISALRCSNTISNIINYYFPLEKCATECLFVRQLLSPLPLLLLLLLLCQTNRNLWLVRSYTRQKHRTFMERTFWTMSTNMRSSIMWRTIDFNGVNSRKNTT